MTRCHSASFPLGTLALSIAAAQGRVLDARAEFERRGDGGLPAGHPAVRLAAAAAAATLEADTRGLPAAEPGRAEALERIRKAAAAWSPRCRCGWRTSAGSGAELLRAGGEDTALDWAEAGAAFEPLDRPYDLARVRHRWAEALLSRTGRRQRNCCARPHATARRAGRAPPAEDIALLAQRARISLTDDRPRPASGRRGARTRAGADPPRGGRTAAGGGGPQQPSDRRGAVHLPEDGECPRLQHPGQAGRLGPRRGGGDGSPPAPVPPWREAWHADPGRPVEACRPPF